MSYILDALHKAEKTRQQSSEAPQPQNITSPAAPKVSSKQPFLLMFLVAGSLALGGFLILSKQAPTSPQISIKPAQNNPATPLPLAQPQPHDIKHIKEAPEPTTVIENKAEDTSIPTLFELPEHMRNTLPHITISGHMHASVAKKRMVIINDQLLREGNYISEGLTLTAITPQGVELTFEGRTFSMKSSEQWPY